MAKWYRRSIHGYLYLYLGTYIMTLEGTPSNHEEREKFQREGNQGENKAAKYLWYGVRQNRWYWGEKGNKKQKEKERETKANQTTKQINKQKTGVMSGRERTRHPTMFGDANKVKSIIVK